MSTLNYHLVATAYLNTELTEKDMPVVESWLVDLVDIIDMNILLEPQLTWCTTPGNEGLTGVLCIDTSHVSIHSWGGEQPYFRFDLYSCKPFDDYAVIDHMERLDVNYVKYSFIDRTDDADLKIIRAWQHDLTLKKGRYNG